MFMVHHETASGDSTPRITELFTEFPCSRPPSQLIERPLPPHTKPIPPARSQSASCDFRKQGSNSGSVNFFDNCSSTVETFNGTNPRCSGITNQTRRSKSAHPRVFSTPNTRNTNASYEQLVVRRILVTLLSV